ncbi:GPR endopeptidase [Thomasclavelia spiroformis]|uniref:GPR endopeptidase n=1 Tax=Thomasclavelia spiroformis TaxID=29348 RepID=UPI00255BCEE5|nr:GPR endopeptidase [Thomasclavelia spiroformis]
MVGDKMDFNNIRSDLAGESLDQLESGKHYNKEEYANDGIKVEKITILKEHQSINQGIGTYVEISFKNYLNQQNIVNEVVNNLKPLIDKMDYPKILMVGLGNRFLTNDAIGPRVLRDLKITHYLDDEDKLLNHYYDILAIAPGVKVQTGMESSEIVKALVEREKIDLVIVVDALCAKNYHKLAHVIQINDVGISPGSGIGNHRKAITKETIGANVIAIGVPTVIYASSLVRDVLNYTMEYFGDSMNPVNKLKVGKRDSYKGSLNESQKEMMLGQIGKLNSNELDLLFNEVLNPIDCNFVLSDKQIDEQCEVMSKIISKSINALRY